jgi:2-oxoglutarate dehydrogenase dihydrolipoamide succinyltransferase (E2 component)
VSSSRTDQAPEAAGEAVQVQMPQMGVSVAEGTIVEWRKRPGDWIEADETIADVSTDKIDVEIPSPASGRVTKLLVEPGETVPVGTPLAEIDTAAKPGEAHPEESERREREPATNVQPAAEPATNGVGTAEEETDRSRFHSPVVRRIAEKHGIDLSQVKGTGIGGRIRKKDLLAYIEAGPERAERPEPVLHIESPYRPEEAAPAAPEAPPEAERPAPAREAERPTPVREAAPSGLEEIFGPSRREPMSPMRQAIARHMLESRRSAAHCTTIVEVDFSRVAARRRELREQMRRRGVNLTYLAFVARATVEALAEFPRFNASVEGEEIVYHDDVNLGIAVALDDGLIVPVIRRAQRLSLEGLAAEIADVASRARERRLEPDEVHGGTFTITNPGQFGAVLATPIINQPQVAILDLEAIVKRPVVVEGPEGDSIAIRPMSFLCASWDHRALDGADAARFLSAIKARLENWEVSR